MSTISQTGGDREAVASPGVTRRSIPPISWAAAAGWFALSVTTFHAAYLTSASWLVLLVPYFAIGLARLGSGRSAFYAGFALGFAFYGPQLGFFWGIFGPAAIALWAVLAFWIGLFAGVAHGIHRTFGPRWALVLVPFLWTGFEYFRSELYYLRFSWLNAGYALAWSGAWPLFHGLGIYGIGFVAALAGSLVQYAQGWLRLAGPALAFAVLILGRSGNEPASAQGLSKTRIQVGGAQVESAVESEIPAILDRLLKTHNELDLLVLPEYTLEGEPSESLRQWCRTQRKHLVVGGREPLGEGKFRNTAFVIDPQGEIVFRQTKSVPIQFFADGEPAKSQSLWQSPWGPLGIAICYDLSYTRVIDHLVQLGALGLIIPTMDAASWGRHQHAMHARVAPVRAAEYGLPIVRVASSGVSQIVDASGRVTASAPFSEQVETFFGELELGGRGRLPWDRALAPFATFLAALTTLALVVSSAQVRLRRRPALSAKSPPVVDP